MNPRKSRAHPCRSYNTHPPGYGNLRQALHFFEHKRYNTHPPGYGNSHAPLFFCGLCLLQYTLARVRKQLVLVCRVIDIGYNTHPPGYSLFRLETHHLEKKLSNPFYLHIKKLLISLRLSLPWMTDHILGSKKAGITIL